MLVLSRKESESIVINENIVVTIIRVAGGGVRIGIEAPREIRIRREELAVNPEAPSSTNAVALPGSTSGLRPAPSDSARQLSLKAAC